MIAYKWQLDIVRLIGPQQTLLLYEYKPARHHREAANIVRETLPDHLREIFEGKRWERVALVDNKAKYVITIQRTEKSHYELSMTIDADRKLISIED